MMPNPEIPSEPPEPFAVELVITSPSATAAIEGEWNGVKVLVTPKPADAPPPDPPKVAPMVTITEPVAGTSFGVLANKPVDMAIGGTPAEVWGSNG